MFLPMIRAMLALNPELRGNPFQGFILHSPAAPFCVHWTLRRCGRAVDCTGLENRQGFTPLVSSNLTASATTQHLSFRPRISRSLVSPSSRATSGRLPHSVNANFLNSRTLA